MLSWLLDNSNRLKLIVFRDQEITKYLPDMHDYMATIELEGQLVWGRGISLDENKAIKAACGELIERATLDYHRSIGARWTSNGIAAHANYTNASEQAIGELIERDAFLAHYLTNTPFREVDVPPSRLFTKKQLAHEGIELRVATMCTPGPWYSAISFCFGSDAKKKFGLFVGASAKQNQREAIEKAINECVALVAGFLRGSQKEKVKKATDGPLFHYRWASQLLETSSFNKLLTRLSSPSEPLRSYENLRIQTLDLHPAFEGCPVTVVRATSPDAQQLFFGETKPEHINFKRLSQFLGKEVRWEDVNKTTHVFA